VHYHFTAADVMEGMVAAAEFLEHAEVHGPLRNPRPRILVQSLDRLTYYGICL
jgi:guanylate kinase